MTYRFIHTEIWDDDWVLSLSPDEKLFWIYLFSNSRTHMIGLYELSWRKAAFETGLDEGWIRECVARFESQGKLQTRGSWVWVKGMLLRNVHNLQSSKVQKGIQRAIMEVPNSCPFKEEWIRHYNTTIAVQYGISPLPTAAGEGEPAPPVSQGEGGEAPRPASAIDAWLRVRGGAVNPLDVEQIQHLVEEAEQHRLQLPPGAPGSEVTGDGWVAEALLEANAARNTDRAVSLNFARSILERWLQQGYKAKFKSGNGSSAVTTTADGRRVINVGV